MIEYFKKVGTRRLVIMLLGNLFIGGGVSIFRLSSLGNDPFTGMNLALSSAFHINYPLFQIGMNVLFLIIEVLFGRRLIGIGTIINACLLGYICDFCYHLYETLGLIPTTFIMKIIVLFIGLVVTGIGISLYQGADAGVSPYDSLPMILGERITRVPYYIWRIICDCTLVLLCFLSGGIVGLGTVAAMFGFGTIIHFTDKHLTEKLLRST